MDSFDYEALAKAGFKTLKVTYSGSNDEGWVNDVQVLEPELPDGVGISDSLSESIRQQAYDVLERRYPGWEINEGSEGHITIRVDQRSAVLSHGQHVESTEWYPETAV